MTVAELIKELEKIENKDLPVVVYNDLDICDRLYPQVTSEVLETTDYFQLENVSKERECVIIN